MNLVLLLLVIAQVCLGACAWLSPDCLRWLAAHVLARADAIDAAREVSERRMRYWSDELGLNRSAPEARAPMVVAWNRNR